MTTCSFSPDTVELVPAPLKQLINDYAENLVKLTMKKKKLDQKLAELQLMVSTLTLPDNCPKPIRELFDKSSTSEKTSIIRSFLRDRDPSSVIADTKQKIGNLRRNYHLFLLAFGAEGSLTTLPISETQADALLETQFTSVTLKFLANQNKYADTLQASKDLLLKKKQEEETKIQYMLEHPATLVKQLHTMQAKINNLERSKKPGNSKKPKPKARVVVRKQKVAKQPKQLKQPKQQTTNNRYKGFNKPTAPANNTNPAAREPVSRRDGMNVPVASEVLTLTHYFSAYSPFLSNRSATCIEKEKIDLPIIKNNGFTHLASIDLPVDIKRMLGYGIKYIPQHNKDLSRDTFLPSLERLGDKIRWKYHFDILHPDSGPMDTDYNPVYKQGAAPFTGDTVRHVELGIKHMIAQAIIKVESIPPTVRLKNGLVMAIGNLRKTTPQIKFIAADKNLGLVSMDLLDYHKMVMQQLDMSDKYELVSDLTQAAPLLESLERNYKQELKDLIEDIDDLTKQERAFLSRVSNNVPKFHMLAKIHKTPLKGRPIVGNTNWITTNLSIFLDQRLQTYLKDNPYILTSSKDLISKWKGSTLGENDLLVSLDVESLYTNISVIDTCSMLNEFSFTLSRIFKMITDYNYFSYNEKLYKQTDGIAMGSNCAVSIANLYMFRYLDAFIAQRYSIREYCRYIDDIGFIFDSATENLDIMFRAVNQLHSGIKFTIVNSKESLDILDLTFYPDPTTRQLEHKTFQKPMNSYLYIPSFSRHPPATLSGFIKGELHRYRWSNSNPFNEHAIRKLFYERLIARGYSKNYLKSIYNSFDLAVLDSTPRRPAINPLYDWIIPFPYTGTEKSKALVKFLKTSSHDFLPFPISMIATWQPAASLGRTLLRSALSKEQVLYISENLS